MSIFGAMTTAVAGLTAQARALGNLSDNIANSQTIGYKRVETTFQDLVTQSTADLHSPGGVRARPSYTNSAQGPIQQTENLTNMAISGNGFFMVSRGTDGQSDVSFDSVPYYTRAGDFSLDRYGYLRNSAGMFLNGWGLDATGDIERGALAPIRIQQLIDNPTPTQNITFSVNLPQTPPTTKPLPPQTVTIIDATGTERQLELNWRQQALGDWRLSIDAPGSTLPVTAGTLPGINDQSVGTPLQTLAGVTAVPQVSTATIGAVTPGTPYSLTVNGQTFNYTAQTFDTAATVANSLFSQINGQAPGTVSISGNTLTLKGDALGNAFTLSGLPAASVTTATTTPAVKGVQQEMFVPMTGTAGDIGDTYSLTFPGPPALSLAYATDGTEANIQSIAERFALLINSNAASPVTASVSGSGLKLVAKTASGTSVLPTATPVSITLNGVAAVPQVSTATIGAVTAGTPYSLTVGTQTFSYTALVGDTPEMVANELFDLVDGEVPGVTVSVDGDTLTLNGDALGNAFTLSGSASVTTAMTTQAVKGVQEEMFVPMTGTAGNIGDTYSLTFPGPAPQLSLAYTTDGTEADIQAIAQRFADLINGNAASPVTASVSGSGLKLVAKAASGTSLLPTATPASINGSLPPYVHLKFDGGLLSAMDTAKVGIGTATVPPNQNTGDPAYIEFQVDYGNGPQTVRLNFGQFGEGNNGLTQWAGVAIEPYTQTQDGFTRGAFRGVEVRESGDIVANYDNGRSRILARVPVIQVTNPDALQKVGNNAFAMTREAGSIRVDDAGANGAGGLLTSSIEGSNVDIAQEFTKMIVTQRAYSANTRVVTTSDEVLQETLGMKR
ncbi:MAG TPA: flagellar hook-basal body complex protein [Azospirillum sp.]|nr:flagellar hook-basal body complex protein [Azospirillum sp.]